MRPKTPVQTARVHRRSFLQGAIALGASTVLPASASAGTFVPLIGRDRDRIRAENDREGTLDWQLTFMRTDPKSNNLRSRLIEGYASRMSVRPGEKLDLMVSAEPASPFEIDVYRLGYYQGLGSRHVQHLGPFQGQTQPVPPVGDERLRECQWDPAVTLEVPRDWTSGVYVAKLTRLPESSNPKSQTHTYQSYITFIARDDRPADLSSSARTIRGTRTTAGRTSSRCTTMGTSRGHWCPAFESASTGRTPNTARSSMPRCRSAPASSCCGNSRWRSGWSSTATT